MTICHTFFIHSRNFQGSVISLATILDGNEFDETFNFTINVRRFLCDSSTMVDTVVEMKQYTGLN